MNYTVNVVRFRVVREPGPRRAPLSAPAAVAALAAQLLPDDGPRPPEPEPVRAEVTRARTKKKPKESSSSSMPTLFGE